jgi:hypothetical protein
MPNPIPLFPPVTCTVVPERSKSALRALMIAVCVELEGLRRIAVWR